MITSLRKIISEAINEVINKVRFQKIRVGLTSSSSCNYHSYDDGYESYPGRSGDESSDTEFVNITPIMASNNPKIKELFSKDELYMLGLVRYDESYDSSVICAEGVLNYNSYYDEDCDGSSSGVSLKIDIKKDDEWNLIKERVKPVLDQNDINEAIKEVGQIKILLQQQKGGKKTFKQVLDDMGVVDYRTIGGKKIYNQYYKLEFNNGKFGLFLFDRNMNSEVIIQPIFDWIDYDFNDNNEINAIKGETQFKLSLFNGKISIVDKSHISKPLIKFRNYKLLIIKKKFFDDGKEDLEEIEKDLNYYFVDMIPYITAGPKREYWKKHYKEAIKYIIDNIKK